MVIHHDKMAYGKLDSLTEKLADDKLAAMAKLLSQSAEKEETTFREKEKAEDVRAKSGAEEKTGK